MNPESKSDNQREIKEEIAPPTHKKSKNSNRYGSTFTRPSIKKDKSALEANVGLRDTDLIDKVWFLNFLIKYINYLIINIFKSNLQENLSGFLYIFFFS